MTKVPKLIIKPFGNLSGDVYNLEEAKNYLNFDEWNIIIEGQAIHTYEELVQMVTRDKYKNMEIIEVDVLPLISGG